MERDFRGAGWGLLRPEGAGDRAARAAVPKLHAPQGGDLWVLRIDGRAAGLDSALTKASPQAFPTGTRSVTCVHGTRVPVRPEAMAM